MFQDFFHQFDDFIDQIATEVQEFDVVLTGDLNIVMDVDKGSLNRALPISERSLATFVGASLAERDQGL